MVFDTPGLAWLFSLGKTQLVVLLVASYLVYIVLYRLYLSPLAKIPGPKLADEALTYLYAAYHDLLGAGSYIWVIEKMHEQYGPIVRIRPDVLHVNDPSFLEVLYPRNANLRREKYHTTLNTVGLHKAGLGTKDHDLHRRRRAVLSPFFSMQNVRRLEPIIQETFHDLNRRMEAWARAGTPAPMNVAYKATTKDIIQAYAFGDGRKSLETEDMNEDFFEATGARPESLVGTYLYYIMALFHSLPPRAITIIMPRILTFVDFIKMSTLLSRTRLLANSNHDLQASIETIRNSKEIPEHKTIFHELLQAKMPDSEKTTERLSEEAMVVIIAGMESTAQTLASITYHLMANPPILKRLKEELKTVMPNPKALPGANKLDGLPYLNAVIHESIRVYAAVTHRQDRVAPEQDLVFTSPDGKTYTIPAGTAVGMTPPLLNRLPSLYPSPHTFNPDRYILDPSLTKYQLAFGKGSRQCLGMNLAFTELQIITAGIFGRYDLYDGSGQQAGPTLELFETTREDVDIKHDFVTSRPKMGTKGVRLRIRLGKEGI